MSSQVSQSITRKSASNLALAFILLPKEKREDMAALYAFCREVDDVADDDSSPVAERRRQLGLWREDLRLACEGSLAQLPVNRELQSVIRRYHLPYDYFAELLRGVEMDLEIHRYPTYTALDQYCYRVASVVGLLSIEIFGYQNPRCRDYAVHLGKALQLTNILRDVRNDAARGRIYLPAEAMDRYHVRPEEILEHAYSTRYRQLASSVADRARAFYGAARDTLPNEDRRTMVAAELMGAVYWQLLDKLERGQFNVFKPALIRVSRWTKLFLILRTWGRWARRAPTPNYGPC